MNKTKTRILTAALQLFNKNGMVNVRLQHVADEANLSVGNLAYHFKNKEAILHAIYTVLTERQKQLLSEYRIVPLFDNIDRLIHHTYGLQQEYVFFYLDTMEIVRAYPRLGAAHQDHINNQISQLRMIIDFNVSRGALITEPLQGMFDQLAVQMWMTTDLWLTQQSIRGRASLDVKNYKKAVWNLLIPHFSEMGSREYKQMLEGPYDLYF